MLINELVTQKESFSPKMQSTNARKKHSDNEISGLEKQHRSLTNYSTTA